MIRHHICNVTFKWVGGGSPLINWEGDLFLCATAITLAYSGSGYSVPTPPLQAFLAPGQLGGAPTVWDLDSSEHQTAVSQVASESPTVIVTFDSDAVEEEDTDHVQTRGL